LYKLISTLLWSSCLIFQNIINIHFNCNFCILMGKKHKFLSCLMSKIHHYIDKFYLSLDNGSYYKQERICHLKGKVGLLKYSYIQHIDFLQFFDKSLTHNYLKHQQSIQAHKGYIYEHYFSFYKSSNEETDHYKGHIHRFLDWVWYSSNQYLHQNSHILICI